MKRALLTVFICVFCLTGLARAQSEGQDLPTEPLTIVTQDGAEHVFEVEVATSPEERQVGLMYRNELAPDHGMIFIYPYDKRVSMWMKNTFIPLDMLFLESDGTVESIRERAVPHSLTPIPSKGRVRAVLELPGGSIDRFGIRSGDKVRFSAFENN
ncbi:DUF192 domain-containing protein [Rhodospirillaceae bacterium KN72]|uniref:DUF192 domain-containing protein n=1 Tax=Pacificispira spongiicola TaxID=2729598 RepID=A0A7Y0E2T3_9PROT|nr:DUF192 domain-containing protein [Pacificispira spongiicola]NMM46189.1 DUF192 domain-containing protein [Pacificispira spongiicola]